MGELKINWGSSELACKEDFATKFCSLAANLCLCPFQQGKEEVSTTRFEGTPPKQPSTFPQGQVMRWFPGVTKCCYFLPVFHFDIPKCAGHSAGYMTRPHSSKLNRNENNYIREATVH